MYTDEELARICAQTDDDDCLTCRARQECRAYIRRKKELPCRALEEEATIICDGQSLSQLR